MTPFHVVGNMHVTKVFNSCMEKASATSCSLVSHSRFSTVSVMLSEQSSYVATCILQMYRSIQILLKALYKTLIILIFCPYYQPTIRTTRQYHPNLALLVHHIISQELFFII